MLKGSNLFYRIGEHEILDDVSIEVDRGNIAAIIGPSGSGKSSLLRLLALIDKPDRGIIELDGDRYESAESSVAESFSPPWPRVSLVFQKLFLWPHLTVRANLMLAETSALTTGKELGPKWSLDWLIERLALTEFVNRYPNQVSFGQQQRAAIARAVITRPRYLLLDEVTSAQDVEHVASLLRFIQTLANEGVGVVLVSHLIGFARASNAQLYFLDRGRVVESGPAVKVLEAPSSQRVGEFLGALKA